MLFDNRVKRAVMPLLNCRSYRVTEIIERVDKYVDAISQNLQSLSPY